MRETKQPIWKLVANLGDATPIDYGGYFVYVDQTGVYPPEAELLEVPDSDTDCRQCHGIGYDDTDPDKSQCAVCNGTGIKNKANYVVYRFILEPCTFENGILSDNPYHKGHPAWFAGTETERLERPQDTTYLLDLAKYNGQTLEELVADFVSEDPTKRAFAWRLVGEYHGWENLDSYPLKLTRKEAEERYSIARRQ